MVVNDEVDIDIIIDIAEELGLEMKGNIKHMTFLGKVTRGAVNFICHSVGEAIIYAMNNKDKIAREIDESAKNSTLLSMQYTDSNGQTTRRLVEPYEIKNDSLYAYCIEKGGIRNFKLARIDKASHTNIRFDPKWNILINNKNNEDI